MAISSDHHHVPEVGNDGINNINQEVAIGREEEDNEVVVLEVLGVGDVHGLGVEAHLTPSWMRMREKQYPFFAMGWRSQPRLETKLWTSSSSMTTSLFSLAKSMLST